MYDRKLFYNYISFYNRKVQRSSPLIYMDCVNIIKYYLNPKHLNICIFLILRITIFIVTTPYRDTIHQYYVYSIIAQLSRKTLIFFPYSCVFSYLSYLSFIPYKNLMINIERQ